MRNQHLYEFETFAILSFVVRAQGSSSLGWIVIHRTPENTFCDPKPTTIHPEIVLSASPGCISLPNLQSHVAVRVKGLGLGI